MSESSPTMSGPEQRSAPVPAGQKPVSAHRGWFIALGIALIIVGVIAILFPVISTLATAVFLGWLIVIAGIMQIVHAFSARGWGAAAAIGFVGLFLTLGGLSIVFFPLIGSLTLTITLAVIFIAEGTVEIIGAFRARARMAGWGWLLASGIVALLAGLSIALALPVSALWVLGLLAGVNFIMSGTSFLMFAGHARRV